MPRAFVGLGANLGDPAAQLAAAVEALGRVPNTRMVKNSSLYRTAPIGYAAQPDFVNAVAQIETELAPADLLRALQAIEADAGRARTFPNAPRTLDLDLLLHGDAVRSTPQLTLPHPRLHQRAFVLRPLLEIAPDLAAPGLGPLADWLPATAGQAVERLD